jgi:hypothetical protein
MEYLEICKDQRCGNCLLSVSVEFVAVDDIESQRSAQVCILSDRIQSEVLQDPASALNYARLARSAVSTVRGDGCYYTNPDGTIRNPRETETSS